MGCNSHSVSNEANEHKKIMNTQRIGNRNAKHQYEIQTDRKGGYVLVDADTRSQAAKIAKTAGFPVLSVNMVA